MSKLPRCPNWVKKRENEPQMDTDFSYKKEAALMIGSAFAVLNAASTRNFILLIHSSYLRPSAFICG
jgi:hypothetical protein